MWILLAASLLIASFRLNISLFFLLITTFWAAKLQIVTLIGLFTMVAIVVTGLLLYRYRHINGVAIGIELLMLFIVINLLSHFVPGFNEVNIVSHARTGEMGGEYSLSYNFDKALIPFVLLAVMPSLFTNRPLRHPRRCYWFLLATSVPILLLMITACGSLKVDIYVPPWIEHFMLDNLFFICLAEEALYRGYLQRRLSLFLGTEAGLLASAAIYGLSHLAEGGVMVIIASILGIILGLAWMWSGRLWVPTLFHFVFNLLQLLFFTNLDLHP